MFGVEKLRPDWTVKTYVIPVSRIGASDEFWAEARTLKNAWNETVAAYRAFDGQIIPLEGAVRHFWMSCIQSREIRPIISRLFFIKDLL